MCLRFLIMSFSLSHRLHLRFLRLRLRRPADSDPFAYAVRSLAQNEFLSPKYAFVPPGLNVNLGVAYLDAFGL